MRPDFLCPAPDRTFWIALTIAIDVLLGACTPSSSSAAATAAIGIGSSPFADWGTAVLPSEGAARYRVAYDSDGELSVEAAFAPTQARQFAIDSSALGFVHEAEFERAAVWQPLKASADHFAIDCTHGCHVRYRVQLLRAGRELQDVDIAIARGNVVFAPPSTWLLRPRVALTGQLRLTVNTTPGTVFASSLECAADSNPCQYHARASEIEQLSFAAFGPLQMRTIEVATSHLSLAMAADQSALDVEQALHWVATSAGAIAQYYQGHLPAPRTLVLLLRGSGGPTRGKTLAEGGPAILLRAGDEITAGTTGEDWVLAHELLHVNFPYVGWDHAWFAEGFASYVEPLARARAGLLAPAKVWRDLIEGLPQGQPEALDQGLENTPTWGRIYWGGALFCFVADVTIRERTQGRHSFDDVVRAVAKTGAYVEQPWPLSKVWEVGDAATGTSVLQELYERAGLHSETVDLDDLFQRLGVRISGAETLFDESAPLAAVRRAMTDPESNKLSSGVDETN
jgi:hypothetical protein